MKPYFDLSKNFETCRNQC